MKYLVYSIASLVVYFLLQFIGAFISLAIFGAGGGVEGKELYFPISMVIIQVIITLALKLTTKLFNNTILLIISLIIPIGLFVYFYFII